MKGICLCEHGICINVQIHPHASEVVIWHLPLSLYIFLIYIKIIIWQFHIYIYNVFWSYIPSHYPLLSPPTHTEPLSFLIFWDESLTEPGVHQSARLAGQRGPRISISPAQCWNRRWGLPHYPSVWALRTQFRSLGLHNEHFTCRAFPSACRQDFLY